MAGNTICVSYAAEVLKSMHDHRVGGHVFKLMLFTSLENLNSNTSLTTSTNEVSGTGYVAGGATLTNIAPDSSGKVGFCSFEPVTFPAADFSTVGAVIYNSTPYGLATAGPYPTVMVLDFGQTVTRSGTDLVVQMPTTDELNSLIRIIIEG